MADYMVINVFMEIRNFCAIRAFCVTLISVCQKP